MSDGFVRRNSVDADKKVDAEELDVGGLTVFRMRTVSCGVDGAGDSQRMLVLADGSLLAAGSPRVCLGRQTLSVTTGGVATLTVPTGAVAALIQADGSAVSMTLDGTTPTASVGLRIDDGVMMPVDSTLANVKLIARTATTNVQVCYFDRA